LVGSQEDNWQYWEDLPEEMEKKLIDKIARFIVKHKMDLIAEILLESGGPLTSLFATLGLSLFGPFLEFFGMDTYTALFRRRENIQRLIDRIEELEREERREMEE